MKMDKQLTEFNAKRCVAFAKGANYGWYCAGNTKKGITEPLTTQRVCEEMDRLGEDLQQISFYEGFKQGYMSVVNNHERSI